jgi:hypothetical protein
VTAGIQVSLFADDPTGERSGSPLPPVDGLVRRRLSGGGASLTFTLASGDLLVMGGSCQRTWEHAVPKSPGAGPRMSVQFRPLGPW